MSSNSNTPKCKVYIYIYIFAIIKKTHCLIASTI